MKKLIVLVAFLTMAAFVSGLMAQGTPPTAPAPAPEKAAKVEKFSGTVDKVDEPGKVFEVKAKTKTMSFTADDQTKITKGGKPLTLADVKKGMKVSVQYKKEGDKNIATAITASAPKSTAKKTKPAAQPAMAPAEKPAEGTK